MNNGLNANFHFLPVSRACETGTTIAEWPMRHDSTPCYGGLMPDAGSPALRVPVDVAEEFGTRVRA